MVFLHPIFNFIFIFLIVCSFLEIYVLKGKRQWYMWVAGVLLVIAAGFRRYVGADYPVYERLYGGFAIYTTYRDVLDKALFQRTTEEIEWIFVLINKILFDWGMPFFMVTFVMAVITISLKFSTIYKYVGYPGLAALFYFMPIFFFEDSGQMRQGIGIAICVFSFRFIARRNLTGFLICLYLAMGFHKTSIVFLPAYWLVNIPMNSQRIFIAIAVCVILSPFEVYRLGGPLIESLTPHDISAGYAGYSEDTYYGSQLGFGLNDIIKIIFIIILILYDKEGCRKIPYYEYFRNLSVFGLCLFYIMRSNAIFAIRLPGVYMFFLTMFTMPSIVYAVRENVQRMLHLGFLTYFVLMYFNFSKGNGVAGNFSSGYMNALWGGGAPPVEKFNLQ